MTTADAMPFLQFRPHQTHYADIFKQSRINGECSGLAVGCHTQYQNVELELHWATLCPYP